MKVSSPPPGTRIVVVSPHSDDGVLSLGASMARWTRYGAHVELLTVFALDPESRAESGGWDRRAGFATEGEAARARRSEDAAACAVLGVRPVWLPFGSSDYERHGDEKVVLRAVSDVVVGADLVLLPGSPLLHNDHAWLTSLLAGSIAPSQLAYYAEHPYTFRDQRPQRARASDRPRAALDACPVSALDRLSKWRAIRCYRSQLPLLALSRTITRGPLALAWADELLSRSRSL